jgi:hypothetical protein
VRISPPRSVDGIYETVDESARLSSLHTVEPISRNGRGESRRPFLGGCDGAPSTRGRFVVVISFRAESIEGIKRFSRIHYHGLGAHVTVRFTTQGTFKLRAHFSSFRITRYSRQKVIGGRVGGNSLCRRYRRPHSSPKLSRSLLKLFQKPSRS